MPSRRGRGRQTGRMARTGTSLVPFEEAVDATRTGDLWIFRGGTVADRVIQTASNSPVNHVGMAVVLEDLPTGERLPYTVHWQAREETGSGDAGAQLWPPRDWSWPASEIRTPRAGEPLRLAFGSCRRAGDDGEESTRLVGVDLTAIMNDARIMPPVALTLLWMASDVMDGRRVVIWCEEAPAYMPTPAFAKPFKGIALRARKRNASFNAIAQMPGDLLENEAGAALVRQARQFIALRNDKAVEADYRTGLGFTHAEFHAVREGMFALPFRTVLIKRQDGQSGLNRFDLSALPQHLNILSGTPSRVRLLRGCLDRHGGDTPKALAEFQRRIHETAA